MGPQPVSRGLSSFLTQCAVGIRMSGSGWQVPLLFQLFMG